MFRPGPPRDRVELPERFTLLDVEVDLAAVRALRAGEPLPLEPKAFDLLLLFAANPGRVVEKQEIFERIWPDAVVTDNALARVVTHLRRELGDDAEAPRFVETVRTRGYRFLPRIEAAAGVAGAPAKVAPGAPSPRGRPVPLALAATAALVCLGLLWWARRSEPAPEWAPNPIQRTIARGFEGQADFSPDGSQLVFSGDAAGGLQLFVRPVEGGRAIQITEGPGPKIDAAWSPDGRAIVYRDLALEGLWLVAPTGGPPRQVTDQGSQPAWFPDGRRLVFSSPGRPTLGAVEWPATYISTLFAVEVASGDVRALTEPDAEWGGHGMPAVSPDGRWIYFATGRLGGGGALWRVAAAGGSPERLVAAPAEGGEGGVVGWLDPKPLAGGEWLLAVEVGWTRRIVRIRLDGEYRVEPLLATAPGGLCEVALARDGRRLLYSDVRNRTSIEEVEIDAEGHVRGERRVLAAPASARVLAPRYAPDGARLLYQRVRAGIDRETVVLERASGVERPIPGEIGVGGNWLGPSRIALGLAGSGHSYEVDSGRRREGRGAAGAATLLARARPRPLVRTPDGRSILFSAPVEGGAFELFEGDLESGDAVQRTALGRRIDYPAVSPEGAWVGFQVAAVGAANELWRLRRAGGVPERLATAPGVSWLGAFSPHGESLVFAGLRAGSWHLGVVSASSPERLLEVPAEITGYLRWPDWSPDGRHLAYERMHYESSLWTIDLPPSP